MIKNEKKAIQDKIILLEQQLDAAKKEDDRNAIIENINALQQRFHLIEILKSQITNSK